MPSNFGSDLGEKYRQFMSRRNGPDQLSRDALILSLVLIVLAIIFRNSFLNTLFTTLGVALLVYSYFRLFSSNVSARASENSAYLVKREEVLGKLRGIKLFQNLGSAAKTAQKKGEQVARQATDRDHRYIKCPKCGQQMRLPKGVGKVRVTCSKCGEKFEESV